MLRHPAAPLVVGITFVALLMSLLYEHSPMPGDLSHAHASVLGQSALGECESCHHEEGLTTGCLTCHGEISSQLAKQSGYHGTLPDEKSQSCASCHTEHYGHEFALINERSWGAQVEQAFRHPHVKFDLTDSHSSLPCADCHQDKLPAEFSLPAFPETPRHQTFLGLSQSCNSCHQDPHAGGLVSECSDCHTQDAFHSREQFDHADLFPLAGGHDGLACSSCHNIPTHASVALSEYPYPFDHLRGETCADCHESPHRSQFTESCDACHAVDEPLWSNAATHMTAVRHEQAGFPLTDPHDNVDCSQCHEPSQPFTKRHPDPSLATYQRKPDTCQGCHTDVHQGQFDARHQSCLDCHDSHFFSPTTLTHAAHAKRFPLTGAHTATPCGECHTPHRETDVRAYADIPSDCKSCHSDPHAGQFSQEIESGDCISCHLDTAETFRIRPFDHVAETGFALLGAHARTDCVGCHIEVIFDQSPSPVLARRFTNTPQDCASCHTDVHRGQFVDYDGCDSCHKSADQWKGVEFDHNTQSRFPLEGGHENVPCNGCHLPVELSDGTSLVKFKPLGRECGDCHSADRK